MKHYSIYALLAVSLVTVSAYGRAAKGIEDCFACPSIFDPEECPCKFKDLEMAFQTCLSFDQVLTQGITSVNNALVFTGPVSHRDNDDRPGTGPNEVHGRFEICFNTTLTKAAYRVTIFNANKNNRNRNEIPVGLFLSQLKAGQAGTLHVNSGTGNGILTLNAPITVLCGLDAEGVDCDAFQGIDNECICCTGMLVNEDIGGVFSEAFAPYSPVPPFTTVQTIAGLYKLVRQGRVAVTVLGSNNCEPYSQYGFSGQGPTAPINGGLIRGQIWGCRTGCPISNDERLLGSCFFPYA